jgi:hypothetical protein
MREECYCCAEEREVASLVHQMILSLISKNQIELFFVEKKNCLAGTY